MDDFHKKTKAAFFWSRILKTPFWAIFDMLPFIMLRDLDATPLQIAIIVALKPACSLFSPYWSAAIHKRPDKLSTNIIWATVLGLLPFFFTPFVSNSWFFVFAFGFYMMLHRGVIPAWMELIKLNLPEVSREKIFAHGSTAGYLGDAAFPFLFGGLLDGYFQAWRWIFPVAALVSMLAIFFQLRIPIRSENIPEAPHPGSLFSQAAAPWKNGWQLLRQREDFRSFQIGFMLGGSGLMIMQAVLPTFFMTVLDLSYTTLAVARTLCKGIGFAISSQMWAKWIRQVNLYHFSSRVTLLAFAFPLALLLAQFHIAWVYIAYLFYGIMQAGSELGWHMSGPIFSRNEDSSPYSSVNVVTVGLRGCIAPGLGAILGILLGSGNALIIGGIFCLFATATMANYNRRYQIQEEAV